MNRFKKLIVPIETYSDRLNNLTIMRAKYLSVPEGPEAKETWIKDLEHRLDRKLNLNYQIILHPLISELINKKYLIVDGFDAPTQTVFEYNDNLSSGNPKLYPGHLLHPQLQIPYRHLFEETERKRRILNMMRYPVLSRWESTPY